jgi:uncharacterized protein YcbX
MPNSITATVTALYRHPVKGLTPEQVPSALLEEGGYFPGDRLFAIENGPSGFDPAAPEHLPKQRFAMLMRQERLARLAAEFDPGSRRLTLRQGGHVAAAGHVDLETERAAIERFLTTFLGEEVRGPLRLIAAPAGHRFMDSRSGFVSLLNLSSVQAIAGLVRRERLDPLRFRANIHLEGLEPWREFDWVGRQITIGEAALDITKRIDRCAAIDVDPRAGVRDLRLIQTLEQNLAHHDCGIYARITRSGWIRPGDRVQLLPD